MNEATAVQKRPHVAVFLDTAGSYGRGLMRGIAAYLDLHGPWAVFIQPRATGQFDLAWLRRWKGDGVLAFVEQRDMAFRLRKLKIPLVETYGHMPDLRIPRVCNDDRSIGRLAAEHLLARRFEHFAFSGYRDQPWAEWRCQSFAETVARAGMSCQRRHHPRFFATLSHWEKAQGDLADWLRGLPKPLGVMACSDRHALNVLDACPAPGLAVPDEVAVIGADNDESICFLSDPPLSSVADNPCKIGFEAAQLLEGLMTGGVDPRRVEPILVPPLGVVTRRSTDITVAEDPLVRKALRFIREHACEDINVAAVLRQIPLSRSAFYRRFHQAVGRPLHDEILRVRLDRVKYLTAQTSIPLAQLPAWRASSTPNTWGPCSNGRWG